VAQPFLAARAHESQHPDNGHRGRREGSAFVSSEHGFTASGKSRLTCGSRLQPRHKCLAINWALAPEGLPSDFFRNLFSRAIPRGSR
jgi:hypothetical protein